MIQTYYGLVSKDNIMRAKKIRLLISDIDGVFSDGLIYMGNNGEELKSFHTKDGFGIKAILHHGIDAAIITGRQSTIVKTRMMALGIKHIYQGIADKHTVYQSLLKKLNLKAEQVAYIGDDVVDLVVIQECGLGVAVKDAHPLVLQGSDLITTTKGGYGAVREICDLLLQCQQKLNITHGKSE